MSDQKSFLLYLDYRQHLELLPDADRGRLIITLFDYAEFGIIPELDGMTKMAFSFIKAQLDRDMKKYSAKCKKNRENILKRWDKDDTNAYENIRTDTKHTDTGIDIDTGIETETGIDTEIKGTAQVPAPSKSVKKKFGEFGWIHLTSDQHSKLFTDLGEMELIRCIQYIDEAAQSSGNKNKWKDWNLVIRRCSRENWGKGNQKGQTQKKFYDNQNLGDLPY